MEQMISNWGVQMYRARKGERCPIHNFTLRGLATPFEEMKKCQRRFGHLQEFTTRKPTIVL